MMGMKAILRTMYLLGNTEFSVDASRGTCMTNIWEVQKGTVHAHSQMPISLWVFWPMISLGSIPLVQVLCSSEVFPSPAGVSRVKGT